MFVGKLAVLLDPLIRFGMVYNSVYFGWDSPISTIELGWKAVK